MGAASPAAGRARRGYGDALRVQAVLLAVTAWSGSVGIAHIASVSGGVRGGAGSPSPAAVGTGRGLAVVWRRPGVECVLKALRAGPGRVQVGGAARVLGVSASCMRAT